MKVLELVNDDLELVGMKDDLLEYLKEQVTGFINSEDIDAMRSIDLKEYADLFEELETKDNELLKITFKECAMDGTATPYLSELVEKGE